MQSYVGTKLVKGQPMNRQEYNDYRGWTLPADENGADAGYLVEYLDGGQPNHPAHTGYISWSPAEQFVNANVALGDIDHLAPHQQRLVAELEQTADRLTKLEAFFRTPLFDSLDDDEKQLMKMQADAMTLLVGILNDRARKFGGAK
jgi:hypothetical protein